MSSAIYLSNRGARAVVLFLTLELPADQATQRPIPMRAVDVRGFILAPHRRAEVLVRASIGTPFGHVPITGHIHATYDCHQFSGTVTYHPIVRFFANLKNVDLVTELDGTFRNDGSTCADLRSDSLHGRALVENTRLSGWVSVHRDTIRFDGPAWTVGDSTYHSILGATRGGRNLEVRVNMCERSSPGGHTR